MDSLDALALARIQFAVNIGFHVLFTAISMTLGWVLFFFRLRAETPCWAAAYPLWLKIFALTFALGVVSGVNMSFQFGTHWPGFMQFAGNVAGPLLAYEVLTAFFLEATFLGIMLFGAGRVSPRVLTCATFLVALGTSLSAFWILALNAWMQTPRGVVVEQGALRVLDWWAVIFNPSLPWRLAHMFLASLLTVAFLLAGLSAYRWLRGGRSLAMLAVLRLGVGLAAVLAPLQMLVGDLHGLHTFRHQPAKIAAIEGVWQTARHVPVVLLGWPDEAQQHTRSWLQIPAAASWLLTHSTAGEIPGLAAFPYRPPVRPVFVAFRLMVGIGVLMWLCAWWAAWRLRAGRPPSPGLARMLVAMSFCGWGAILAGWCVTEVGRQPFLIQDLLLTRQAAAVLPASWTAFSLAGYLLLAMGLLLIYVRTVFWLARQADAEVEVTDV